MDAGIRNQISRSTRYGNGRIRVHVFVVCPYGYAKNVGKATFGVVSIRHDDPALPRKTIPWEVIWEVMFERFVVRSADRGRLSPIDRDQASAQIAFRSIVAAFGLGTIR